MKPLVSICCITYNQEKYVEETLKGFLIQKTSFPIEILIHDDASTDITAKILRKYEKIDDRISVIYQTENKYSQGKKPLIHYLFPKARGKYIALCEGDDYWTDSYKLQKQVDFLERNEKYSLVFSNAKVLKDKGISRGLKIINKSREFNGFEIIENWTIPTASVLFRKDHLINNKFYESIFKQFLYGDIILFLILAQKGKLYGMSDYMVTYRRHGEGALLSEKNNSVKAKNKMIKHHKLMSICFNGKYKKLNYEYIANTYLGLFYETRNFQNLWLYNKYLCKKDRKHFYSINNLKINVAATLNYKK
ncbi:Glycosyltransferase involved in cell wall bisynthesis [Salegentibacter agarivorans]|uniref:Glycosyltransferase involved in cell wall bisynthesis n=1 Tax=Salegentibacter agarivorans TaxID=345907 RepID=A0A1I2JZ32_9FLAO|nr:glycosyltransferase [Salegentibacter agarivorans]SFF60182.1 Glycosyltransferase involved in cell wall bisynthesis [Salegentibacter agarivorans]